ncbi:hypothetical protein JOC75_001138 [Metabacillus crassostreae]|uniref:hypothetical protein n=1 Tax=Metabacillus crassostreae TaxID=929098 RepID=UPI00195AA641|nr:hypothetical protein [Metabacillus crassostreae]MBM7603168.1 hypothetical protein [Metabacillus crassostreae]
MKVIEDFNSSVPSNFSQSLDREIPSSPSSITLAAFGLAVNKTNSDVLLLGEIGIQSLLGVPQVLLTVFRNTGIIGTIQVNTLAVNELRNASFQIIDKNPPLGYHSYRVTAQVLNPLLNQASAVGPISLSGTSISPVG